MLLRALTLLVASASLVGCSVVNDYDDFQACSTVDQDCPDGYGCWDLGQGPECLVAGRACDPAAPACAAEGTICEGELSRCLYQCETDSDCEGYEGGTCHVTTELGLRVCSIDCNIFTGEPCREGLGCRLAATNGVVYRTCGERGELEEGAACGGSLGTCAQGLWCRGSEGSGDEDEGRCRPLCQSDAGCDVGETCNIVSSTGERWGFCMTTGR